MRLNDRLSTEVTPDGEQRRAAVRHRRWRDRSVAIGVSLAAHVGALLAVLTTSHAPVLIPDDPIVVELIELAPPAPPQPKNSPTPSPAPPKPATAKKPVVKADTKPKAAPKAPPQKILARATAAKSSVQPLPASGSPKGDTSNELSDGQLASAATAESSGGGGGATCNMVRYLQAELRKDPEVHAAVAAAPTGGRAGGKALMVWNGDWVRSQGEEGEGLAIVRQAMMVEIAFAPEACRANPVRGLVAISLSDGGARLVMGADNWRWSEMLTPRWMR
jgi:hypothetical protein